MNKLNSTLSATFVAAVSIIISLGLPVCASAQSATTSANEISFYLGEDLPSGIDNVTEILPLFGGRYGIETARIGVVELGLFNAHAKGVDFATFEASLRGNAPISPGLEGLYYGGLDFNYYIPENQTDRRSATGFHVGAGAMMQLTDTLWLRGDLKFMGGPGSSLIMLFGILFK